MGSAAPAGYVLRCGPGFPEAYAKESLGPLTGDRWQSWPDVIREARIRAGCPNDLIEAAATTPLPSDGDGCAVQCTENRWEYMVEVTVTCDSSHARVRLENRLPYFEAPAVEVVEEATAEELYRAVPRALAEALRRLHETWGEPPHALQTARRSLREAVAIAGQAESQGPALRRAFDLLEAARPELEPSGATGVAELRAGARAIHDRIVDTVAAWVPGLIQRKDWGPLLTCVWFLREQIRRPEEVSPERAQSANQVVEKAGDALLGGVSDHVQAGTVEVALEILDALRKSVPSLLEGDVAWDAVLGSDPSQGSAKCSGARSG